MKSSVMTVCFIVVTVLCLNAQFIIVQYGDDKYMIEHKRFTGTYELKDSLPDGIYIVKSPPFFENFTRETCTYFNGMKNGECVTYYYQIIDDVTNIKVVSMHFRNGTPDGNYIEIGLNNSNVQCYGQYSNGSMTGDWLYYNENSVLIEKDIFDDKGNSLKKIRYK